MTPAETPEETEQRVGLILACVATVLLLASLGQTSVSPAFPTIAAELGGLDRISWLVTAYLLASTISAPICGKLGDLFGRKIVIQVGIVIFLGGSVVAGLGQTLEMVTLGRAIQGLGGGGLIVTAMAVVADVLPARRRGRVQGMMGGVFGVSTVIGPLIGGFLVEQLSWHWIFFFNLPLGLAVLVILQLILRRAPPRARPPVDYMGAALLATLLSCGVLIANLGGRTLAWDSGALLTLALLGVAAVAGFIVTEARAREPILPLTLFANNNFVLLNLWGMISGAAMFGTITFMPLYLQVVQGVTPTVSGMFLLPMMAGIMGSSILAGQVMVATGRYKFLPIMAAAALTVAMLLMATLAPDTPLWQVAVFMAAVGLGIGPAMSVGATAIQNAVASSMLGVATASANMFRLIGGSIGTSVFGAMFASGLQARLAGEQARGALGDLRALDAATVANLPPDLRDTVLRAFSEVLHPIFLIAAALSVVAGLASLALKEVPLSTILPNPPPEA
ncbi:MDR family MFS transporter [Pararhodobacter marinus]|uniref:MDR family MFS transporter n=1 Tax=Pararhodobacter marinus TaxID=2184063 RepID=UPI0035135CE3